jgi:prophage regulatory protein
MTRRKSDKGKCSTRRSPILDNGNTPVRTPSRGRIPATLNTERMLRTEEVSDQTGLSKTSIYRFQRTNFFPRSVAVEGRSRRWRESDIQNWIEESIRESQQRRMTH